MEERKREWIHKPAFHGVPVSRARGYLRWRVEEFRKEHQEFDEFLIELNHLLKQEDDINFINIEKFIDGESESNWISPKGVLFDVLIKLFNLCLSPRQEFEYIKECSSLYSQLNELDYTLSEDIEISYGRDRFDGKYRDHLHFSVIPIKRLKNRDYHHWYDISVSTRMIEDHINDISTHISGFELRCSNEKLKDTLMLFDYYQCKDYRRKVFESAIKELIDKNFIKKVSQEDFCGLLIHDFEIKGNKKY